ncbi:hypothetical protein BJ912DRAFT_1039791 [Pholiota molesta]|nr:hypothetical protein BJ912DRAFT_1039791 [Pholiota molesta]
MDPSLHLPLDIFHCIVETLDRPVYNFDALKSCSMVCKALRPICAKYMFAKIIITDQNSHPRPSLPIDQIKDLMAMNPRLATYIKELVIVYEPAVEWENPNLPVILNQLQNVDTLSLNTSSAGIPIDWQTIAEPLKISLERLISSSPLTDLRLDGITDFPIPWILAGSTSLKNLQLSSVKPYQSQSESTIIRPNAPPPQLRSFAFNLATSLQLGDYCSRRNGPGRSTVISFVALESLSFFLEYDDPAQVEVLKMYLDISTGLRRSSYEGTKRDPGQFFRLSYPSSLETLQHLTLAFAVNGNPSFAACDELTTLAAAKSPLQSFELALNLFIFDSPHVLEAEVLNGLTKLLTIENFLLSVFAHNPELAEPLASQLSSMAKVTFHALANDPDIQFRLIVLAMGKEI